MIRKTWDQFSLATNAKRLAEIMLKKIERRRIEGSSGAGFTQLGMRLPFAGRTGE
jgi:hypothetical protein